MGPKRRERSRDSRSSTPAYDLNKPENWTVAKLRKALNEMDIPFPSNCKRTRLITLYKTAGSSQSQPPQSQPRASASSRADMTSRDHDNNNNGGDVQSIWQAVKDLSAVVGDLKSTVHGLASQQQGDNVSNSAANTSTRTVDRMEVPGTSTQAADGGMSVQQFTLQSAYGSPSPSMQGPNTLNQGNYVRTKYGYCSESLPFVDTVFPSIRRAIIEGRDVNLASLLIPYYHGPSLSDDKPKNDPRLHKNLNLGEFIQAFGIYKSIMCESFPQRRQELDLYERDIVDMAQKYGKAFYEYHKQFSLKAAAHLKYQNIPVDWSVRNNTLFCNIFADQKPNTCHICHSISHTAGFCPSLVAPQGEIQSKKSQQDPGSRQKVYSQGREICNHYNGDKGCMRQRCGYLHVCLVCQKNHPKIQCTDSKPKN